MKRSLATLLIYTSIIWTDQKNIGTLTDVDYKQLPPIFHIDPYEKCIQEKNIYCTLSLKLTSTNTTAPSKFWKFIEQTKNSPVFYSHDILSHAVCIEKHSYKHVNNETLIKEIEETYANQYKNHGLSATVFNLNCEKKHFDPNSFDFLLICFYMFYTILLMVSTFSKKNILKNNTANEIINFFSLRRNFLKNIKTYNRSPYGKLKFIQSLRFYTTTAIILVHTVLSFVAGYIDNTGYVENAYQNIFKRVPLYSSVFLVQIYFLISGYLLSYQTFKVFENTKKGIYMYTLLKICNRFFRLLPPVLAAVSLIGSVWFQKSFDGPVVDIYAGKMYKECRKNWWTALLFVSNHINNEEMCLVHLWYLSADIQLYILSLVCLTIAFKTKRQILTMVTFTIIGIGIHSLVTYVYNFDILLRITPEFCRNFLSSALTDKFNGPYTSFHTNMATYILGLIFGYVYFCLEDKSLVINRIAVVFYWIFSLSLPILAVTISCYTYDRFSSAIWSGLLKPLWTLGIGFIILGVGLGIGDPLKKFLEWKPTVYLGSFTYTTYVTHIFVVFYRTITTSATFKMSDSILAKSFLTYLCLSFLLGIVTYLTVEMPASHLQNRFIPKFKINETNKQKTR